MLKVRLEINVRGIDDTDTTPYAMIALLPAIPSKGTEIDLSVDEKGSIYVLGARVRGVEMEPGCMLVTIKLEPLDTEDGLSVSGAFELGATQEEFVRDIATLQSAGWCNDNFIDGCAGFDDEAELTCPKSKKLATRWK
jgi:hypothetical protein